MWSRAVQSITSSDCSGFGTGLYVMAPCRVVDSRDAAAPLDAVATRTVQVAGRCGIPSTAKAVAANVTVVRPQDSGELRLRPSGVLPIPIATTMSYRLGRTRASSTLLTLSGDGKIDVNNNGPVAVHFIIDISAYFK
jgi:hypothetical protein